MGPFSNEVTFPTIRALTHRHRDRISVALPIVS
jgi:hypothetical protein